MIRKIAGGKYRLYSKKKTAAGKRRNLGTFDSREAAESTNGKCSTSSVTDRQSEGSARWRRS